jgi:hypothetical protein
VDAQWVLLGNCPCIILPLLLLVKVLLLRPLLWTADACYCY